MVSVYSRAYPTRPRQQTGALLRPPPDTISSNWTHLGSGIFSPRLASLRFTGLMKWLTHGHRRGLSRSVRGLTGTGPNGNAVAEGENPLNSEYSVWCPVWDQGCYPTSCCFLLLLCRSFSFAWSFKAWPGAHESLPNYINLIYLF